MLAPLFTLVVLSQAPSWQDIDALVKDGKLEAASTAVKEKLAAARASKQDEEVARALIRQTSIRISMGDDSAIRALKEEAWPTALVPRTVVEVYFALLLDMYTANQAWEIARRERVDTKGVLDLELLTAEQLHEEIERAWAGPWERREALGAVPLSSVAEFITPNDFPPGVRDTLRDFITLNRASALGASGNWTEAQRNELFRVPLESLLGPTPPKSEHPLARAVALLADLEAWDVKAGRKEGALYARLTRLEFLWNAYTDEASRAKVLAALQARIQADASLPLSAWARSIAAEWLRNLGEFAQARDVAAEGARAFPSTVGGRACKALVARLEAPDYQLEAPLSDGPTKRSLTVSAKNLSKLHFRAFKLDPDKVLGQSPWDVSPTQDELIEALRRRPVASWAVDLPATPDLRLHRTHVTPPLDAPGAYLVAASALESFKDEANRIIGVFFIVSDLVMTVSQVSPNGTAEVVVREGATGAPVAGVDVTLYAKGFDRPRRTVARARTDVQGLARLQGSPDTDDMQFVVAKKGAHLAVDESSLSFWRQDRPRARDSALLYTDRAIYRPGQTIQWKVVAWRREAGSDDLKVAPGATVKVTLYDANGQPVATQPVKTNEFGSASGEFAIPVGRMLGSWRLSARDTSVSVRVEEYKRPTFEVAFKDTGAAMKLGARVTLQGEARYYFGLPVTAGKVRWRVQREPVFPWWFRWWAPPVQRQTIATGTSDLKADGTFTCDFTPDADPKQPRDVTWSFSVEADVTEDGGETRSAKKLMRLGYVSVEAAFDVDAGFLREATPAAIKVRRTNLDGEGRAGRGTWKLFALEQPAAPVAWADEPVDRSPFEKKPALVTPGDEVRARANVRPDVSATLRRWRDGKQVAAGEVQHEASGEGVAKLPALAPGAYRLRYETKDEAGATLSMATELVVSGASSFPLAVPAWLRAESSTVSVGSVARFLVGSGAPGQQLLFEVIRDGKVIERRWLVAGKDPAVIERLTTKADRGGFGVRVTAVRDWGVAIFAEAIDVPWDDKALTVEFSTFRDTLRPGTREQFRVTVKGQGTLLEPRAAELLASMYDKSLDAFAPLRPPRISALYPTRSPYLSLSTSLAGGPAQVLSENEWYALPAGASFRSDGGTGLWQWLTLAGASFSGERISIGDLGTAGGGGLSQKRLNTIQVIRGAHEPTREPAAPPPEPPPDMARKPADAPSRPEQPVRSNFAETAFFAPHLVLGEKGEVAFEVPAPDSVTAWNLWVEALTRDLRGGSASATVRTVKDLMVRPALPRFLREGDKAALKLVVNNAGKKDLSGEVRLELLEPSTQRSVAAEFGVKDAPLPFSVKAGQSVTLTVQLQTPRRVGEVAVKVVGKAGDVSDGELRAIPLLPSRMRLTQSRFVTVKDAATRTMSFEALVKEADPTRLDEQLVVTVDGQLFTTVLAALPYLTRYPYECTEQTLNRFLSTGIVASVFKNHPAVAKAAKELSKRKTPYETFDALDPNRKAALEETPWLVESSGWSSDGEDLVTMLDPAAVEAERASALRKLEKMQLPDGAFPWFPGGRASPAMTLYLLQGFARALEFKLDVPRLTVARAWGYVGGWYRSELKACMKADDCSPAFVTTLVHAASAWPDDSWLSGEFGPAERKVLLDYGLRHWQELPPYLKGLLALALHRAGRTGDAQRVFDSVMNTAKTTPDEGTFWQPGERGWLWYHDTIEGHAFALRVLMELSPKDPRRDGLVQWLLLNKKLNHWKSTRASAEAIYALVKYLSAEKSLGLREVTTVSVGAVKRQLVFEPDTAAMRKQQVVVAGKDLDPKTMATVTVSKETKGFQFASATWHFSTDRLPEKGSGDLFEVKRTYFKRVKQGPQVTLQPLNEGARLEPGDELEVQLAIRAKQQAEYVHLRDPRGAGFEPDVGVSRYRFELGLAWYEELRDSGTNFFFEALPPGEYTLKYRVRAAMGGTFRVGPATLQSMYAPEFTAYSAGHVLTVGTGGR
ncbi:MAG: MG2 domain-containing protein [Myxococcota bacterium]